MDCSVLLFTCLDPHKHSEEHGNGEGEVKPIHKWEREDEVNKKGIHGVRST